MINLITDHFGQIAQIVVLVVGLGVGWGVLKTEVAHLRTVQEEDKLEIAKTFADFSAECDFRRNECDKHATERRESMNKRLEMLDQIPAMREDIAHMKGMLEILTRKKSTM